MSSDREEDRRSVLATIGPLEQDLELSETRPGCSPGRLARVAEKGIVFPLSAKQGEPLVRSKVKVVNNTLITETRCVKPK